MIIDNYLELLERKGMSPFKKEILLSFVFGVPVTFLLLIVVSIGILWFPWSLLVLPAVAAVYIIGRIFIHFALDLN